MSWIEWLQSWGDWFYPLAFIWAFFEGETFVIFGGMAAHLGVLDLRLLIVTVWLGSFCGDQMWFWIGRRWGNRALDRIPGARPRAERVFGWLDRYGVGFILSFRFLYGVRNVASIAVGTSSMPWRRFLVWNFIAAGLWALIFAFAGYLLGEAAAGIGEYGPKILVGVLVVAALAGFGWRHLGRIRRRRAAAPESRSVSAARSTLP